VRELSLHILDLLENAVEAGASRVELAIVEDFEADELAIFVRDNGRGMEQQTLQQAVDPFFTTRTTRHVGLGLPLLAAAARRCDGDLVLESAPGVGTEVRAAFRHSHLDRAPLGKMADTLLAFLLYKDGSAPELHYLHRVGDQGFELDTAAVQAELVDIPLSHPAVRGWLYDYFVEGEAELAARP
jgi:hypothetical protein